LAGDVELPASSDESMEALSLSKENEVEEVDLEQPEIQLGYSDEEEYTSDENESDNEDVNAEFDISPTSEDEMENLKIWFEDDVQLLHVGGERVVGGDLLPFLHLHHRQEDPRPLHRYHRKTHDLYTSTTGNRTHDLCTSTTGSRGIIDSQSIQMSYVLDLHGQPLQEQISNILCTMFEGMQKEYVQAQIRTSGRSMGLFR
ncbi:hypothetical protein Taro_049675, partial [Colocasia esculenta]|nr:hypothetical protein [Colocasia esculenta]